MSKIRLVITLVVLVMVLAAVFLLLRQAQAARKVEQEWQKVPAAPGDLQVTQRLEILPLYEKERVEDTFAYGHGVSYLVRTDTTTILIDLGMDEAGFNSLPVVRNMARLGVDWAEIDAIVISHPHPDHVGGNQAWWKKTISIGEVSADLKQLPVYTPVEMTSTGARLVYSPEPVFVSADVATSGVISFREVFPLSLVTPANGEQALVVSVAGEGLVVITGCGHPTLERLVTRAEALYGIPVVGVVGGLHYMTKTSGDLQEEIGFLRARQPGLVALSPHDSGADALRAFEDAFPLVYQTLQVGRLVQFP